MGERVSWGNVTRLAGNTEVSFEIKGIKVNTVLSFFPAMNINSAVWTENRQRVGVKQVLPDRYDAGRQRHRRKEYMKTKIKVMGYGA